jgi:hypothetical protein
VLFAVGFATLAFTPCTRAGGGAQHAALAGPATAAQSLPAGLAPHGDERGGCGWSPAFARRQLLFVAYQTELALRYL